MEWLLDLGYLGLFLGTFLAGTVLPLSSDVLLIGMLAAKADPAVCLVVAAVGNWLGAMTSYWLGWYARWEWLGRWFGVRPETLEKQKVRVDRFGVWLAPFFWAPVIGLVFMIRAGNLPRAASHDGVHGACRLVRPVSFLGVVASGVRLTGEEGRPGIAAGI